MTTINDLQKKITNVMELYGSIPEGHFTDDQFQDIINLVDELDVNVLKLEELAYEEIRARRDNMTKVGDLDYEI